MSKYSIGGGGCGGAGMPGFTASDANMRKDELERLLKLNIEMVETFRRIMDLSWDRWNNEAIRQCCQEMINKAWEVGK